MSPFPEVPARRRDEGSLNQLLDGLFLKTPGLAERISGQGRWADLTSRPIECAGGTPSRNDNRRDEPALDHALSPLEFVCGSESAVRGGRVGSQLSANCRALVI